MNKSFVTIVFLVAALISMGAISEKPDYAITVKFQEYSGNPEIAGILKALDASQVAVTLCADSLDTCQRDVTLNVFHHEKKILHLLAI